GAGGAIDDAGVAAADAYVRAGQLFGQVPIRVASPDEDVLRGCDVRRDVELPRVADRGDEVRRLRLRPQPDRKVTEDRLVIRDVDALLFQRCVVGGVGVDRDEGVRRADLVEHGQQGRALADGVRAVHEALHGTAGVAVSIDDVAVPGDGENG